MKREVKKYLYDIKVSIDSIFDYLGDKRDFFEYQNNKLLRRAVEREIEIIGEAMNRILKIAPDVNIENARQIVDTRNWVIHGYDKVDDVVIWGIISKHLPKLIIEVEKLLEQ
ncbi:HepT-like ribonuclease domain-containing protein [Saccharicrinis aurantiacus]|uniref:HepT-like ribonuclease domain-containing protein n=1 Tax=Saccharicrinis aurantiacus TaxID=1849719 RepID=UPI00094F9249|nr:HepT-like ribonuclease domain-containing protein [Saccharicrinis aurantiacus]